MPFLSKHPSAGPPIWPDPPISAARRAPQSGPEFGPELRPNGGLDVPDWRCVAHAVGNEMDLTLLAHEEGALLRRRGIVSAEHLLCLALMHGPGRMPLRLIVEHAADHGLGQLSEPALFRRLSHCTRWLNAVARDLLRNRLAALAAQLPDPVALDAAASAAFAFIRTFTPWPPDMFNETQIHLLLCIRWTTVVARLRCGLPTEESAQCCDQKSAVLGETRNAARLIGAIMCPDA